MFKTPDPYNLDMLSHSQQEVLRGLVAGQSITAAARTAGVHRATVHLWFRTDATFSRALDAQRRLRADRIADDLNDLADSALRALRQIIDDTAAPAAVRYKAAIDVIRLTQNHEVGRLDQDGAILANLHAELDATVEAPPAATPPTPSEATERATAVIKQTAHPNEAMRSAPVRNAPCRCGSRLKYKHCCGKTPPQSMAA